MWALALCGGINKPIEFPYLDAGLRNLRSNWPETPN